MDTTHEAALLRAPIFSSALERPEGTLHADFYSRFEEQGCDPESVRAFRGVLTGVVVGALLWVPILWLIL